MRIELNRLFAWATLPATDSDTFYQESEVQDFLGWAKAQPIPDQNELLAVLSERLLDFNYVKAATVLAIGGCLVEAGADPEILFPAGLAYLQRLQDETAQGKTISPAVWRNTVVSLMAHLTRSVHNRAQLSGNIQLLDWLEENEELSDHFYYLLQMAGVSDEDGMQVVFPQQGTGLEIDIRQVNNVFHLMTLIQPLVAENRVALGLRSRPRPTPPALLRFAQGLSYDAPRKDDYNRYEWLNALAYEGGPVNEGQVAWGELAVSALPRVSGRVLLIGTERTRRMERKWSADFLRTIHDAHNPTVTLRRLLTPEEVRVVLGKIHVPVPLAHATGWLARLRKLFK